MHKVLPQRSNSGTFSEADIFVCTLYPARLLGSFTLTVPRTLALVPDSNLLIFASLAGFYISIL